VTVISSPVLGRAATALAVVALTAGLAACGSSKKSSTTGSSTAANASASSSGGKLPSSIPITFVGDLTGAVAYVGQNELQGMKLAVDQVNSSNVLKGSKLVLDTKDTASDQAKATTQMSQAVNSKAVAILGPLLSNEALATAPIAQRGKVVDVATQSQNSGLLPIGNYIYRITASQLRYDNLLAEQVAKKGAKTVKLIYDSDNPTLTEVAKNLLPKKFAALGIKVTDSIGIPTATTDYASIASKLASGKPDSVGMLLVGAQFPALIKALGNAGWKGAAWGDSAATAGALGTAGAAGNGFFYALDFTETLDYPSSKAFVTAFKAANPSAKHVYGYNAVGYDAVQFIAKAIAASGDASRDGVLKGAQMVSQTGFDGALGPIKFTDPDKRDISVPGVVVEWQGGAEKIIQKGDQTKLVQP
jgi:branched-chain amino acid transport system substrate-binding protein